MIIFWCLVFVVYGSSACRNRGPIAVLVVSAFVLLASV